MDIGEAIDHVWGVYTSAFSNPILALAAITATAGAGWVLFKGVGAWFTVWVGHHAVKDSLARARIGDVEKQLQAARIEHSHCMDMFENLQQQADRDRAACEKRLSVIYQDLVALAQRAPYRE